MKKFLFMATLLLSWLPFASIGAQNVAKVGTTEYATIEEAIEAWGPGKTLTLLADVTTTSTVTVEVNATKSTQNWTLELGNFTWTATGCNAFNLYAAGGTVMNQNNGLKIYANQNGGITASGKYCIQCTYDNASAGYRPRLEIHGGTYNGSYVVFYGTGVYTSTAPKSNGPSIHFISGSDGAEPIFNGNLGLSKCPITINSGYFNGTSFITYPVSSTADTNLNGGHFKTINSFPSPGNNKGIKYGTSRLLIKSDASIDVINGAPTTYEASTTQYSSILTGNRQYNGSSSSYYPGLIYFESANYAIQKYNIPIKLNENVVATQDKTISASATLTIDATAEGSSYTGNIVLANNNAKLVMIFPEGSGHYGVSVNSGTLHVVETVADGIVTRTYSRVSTISNPEAKVGSTNYSTVYDAFYAIDGTTDNKTIVLQKDVTNAGIVTNGTATGGDGKTVATFDLNGHSIGIGSAAAGNNADYTLTIIDSSEGKTGTVTNSDASLFILALTGISDYSGSYTLKVQGGTWQFDPSNVVINGETHNLVDEGYVAKDNGNGTWTVKEITPVAKIGEQGYATLQAAVDAAQQIGGEVTVNIISDISGETVTINEVANFKLTIDGKKDDSSNYTVDAIIVVDGLRGNGGSTTNGASVTIQNVAFVKTTATDGIQASHYPHHLTIQDCTYSGFDSDKWFFNASVDGPLYGVTIKNVTVEKARLIYANMADDAVFQNITATNDIKVGFNTKTSGTALIENCQVTTGKYAFRDYSDPYEGTYTLKDNTFVSTSTAADEGAIVNRGGAVGTAHINVESGTYTGPVRVLNDKEGVLAISGGYFSEEFPQEYIAADLEGKVCVPATDMEGFFTVGDPHYVAQIGETQYVSLQAAIDAAHEMTGDVTIELIDDIAEYAIVKQKADLNLTIDGKGKTMSGNIVVNGMGRHTGTETLTIQDIKFVGDKANLCSGTSSFVEVPSLKTSGTPYYTNGNNYAHNITIKDCSFTSTEVVESERSIRAFGSASGGGSCYNITINNVTGSNLHSLAQFVGATGGIVTNNTVTDSESFMNVNGGGGEFTVSGNTFTSAEGADGYGIRENGTSSAVITLTDNTFNAANAFVMGKGSSVTTGTINVISGTYVGDITKTDAATGQIVISGGRFSAPLADAQYAEFIAEGLCGVNGLYPEEELAKNGIGTAVASVTNGETTLNYASLEAAFAAAADGSTVTLLADASGNGIKVPQGKFTTGLIVDFGSFTYTVDGETVGSTGTQTQAFQLLKDNKITFKNGTIYSEKAKMLVQNYSDLTLEGMTLTLNNSNYTSAYTLSNNNGSVVIDGSTINVNPAGGFAFDVCRYASYPSVNVEVKGESVINGNIEISASGNDAKDGFGLKLTAGTFNGNIVLDASAAAAMKATPEKVSITKADAVNVAAPEDYKWVATEVEGFSKLAPKVYVAQIGDVKYESLAEAVAAVPADGTETTITMIADEAIVAGITIASGKNIVLELNGKVVSYNSPAGNTQALITNRGTLVIQDNTDTALNGTGTGLIGADYTNPDTGEIPGYASNTITNGGTLTVKSGKIVNTATGGAACYVIDNNSTTNNAILNIEGGYVYRARSQAVRMFCNSTTYQNTLNISGGIVEGGYAGFWTQLPGDGSNPSSSKKLATINITGGEVKGGEYSWYDYSFGDSFEAVEYNISGGKFTGYIYSYAVAGGTIPGFITGGLFSPAPSSSYIKPEGYMFGPSEEVEGYYTLVPAEVDYSWIDNGVEYHDYLPFNTPFKNNYLMDGEFITLLQDITLTEDLTWNTEGDATFTLNLGEFKITKGNFSIKLNPGQRVNTDKTTSISTFSADEGYVVKSTKDENGKYYYTVEEAEVMYTAANGTVKYMLFSSSMVSSDGTYKLLKDVTTDARLAPGIMASNITLDLNGHMLTSTATDCAILLSRAGSSSKPKTFNLIDTSDEKGGMLKVNPDVNIGIQVSGKYNQVTIGEGVTVDGDCVALLGENQTLIVNGAINGGNDFAVSANGSTTKNTTITINEGAVLTSNVAAMYLPGNEGLTATVNGGAITGGTTGIEIRAGQLVVNGGNITSTATEYSYTPNGSGTTTKGAAIAIVQHNTKLPIDAQLLGGTLTGLNQIAVIDAQENNLEGVAVKAKDELIATTTIPEDFKWVSNGDGTSSLAPKDYVAQIEDGDRYESLAEAVEAAEEGATITLLATTDEAVEVAKTLTIVKGEFTAANVTAADDFLKTETDEKITIAKFSDLDIVLVDGEPYTFTKDTQVNSASYVRKVGTNATNIYLPWYVPFDYIITEADAANLSFYRINLVANAAKPGEVQSLDKIWVYLSKMGVGDKLTANRPYVFKATTADTYTFTTEGAMLYAPATDSRLENSTSAYKYDFKGTYDKKDISGKYTYYLSASGMSYPGENVTKTLGSYRWYIEATPKENGGNYAPVFVFTEDDDATGISQKDNVVTEESYYNLNGMRINKPTRGTYIIKYSDGSVKKVAVK